ncbi:putative methyltransferase-domain-containing protein [Aspergillus coremiiformis]|uniref:Putative methyltransferase-domain-containing protein n=1 Tax=Aspergillus coremiiformis TaxID=138285 RepID=A0A5N6Z758_9EURO|nr:putative methyltransferase-domain-containing protein [Aspergillus coremiiformis]
MSRGSRGEHHLLPLNTLTAQYFQQLDPAHLSLPNASTIIHPDVQTVIYDHMFNEATVWPLPPVSYRARVLKTIISRIEEAITDPEEDELNSDLIETWTDLISRPKPSQIQQVQQLTYIKYTAPAATTTTSPVPHTVITNESRGLIYSSGTTGFRTWEASLHLGTYLSTPTGAAHLAGKRVIELGAGTGFVSMYAAKYLQPQFVLATDREGPLIGNMKRCKERNGLGAEFGVGAWEWGTPLVYPTKDDTEGAQEDLAFDVALGADLTYDTDLLPLLFATLHDLFDNYHVKEFILSATLRNQKTFQAFLDACENNLFKAECLPFESSQPEDQTGFFHETGIPIRTYRVTR